ncbi:MAG: hypothetical protein KJ944_18515 [Alphaproteobacteria bacterium]|nr:hypothetical protein [Alphaproteobacteria bacterium]MBU1561819.1 hypothetical protein [Alphaproteobacteria bacterium]MBU2304583.1 hypothetical protein [Alphaproteobacteria bacterium]MBU2368085.1 hypothetical protein [Alphaproteobacteria bacterium]
MFTLLLVLSFIVMAGLAAAGLLLSAADQGAGTEASTPSLSDLSSVEPR